MKYHLFLLFTGCVFWGCSQKHPEQKGLIKFDAFPLEVPEQNSLLARWETKTVLKTLVIDDMENNSDWTKTGIGEVGYTQERARDGAQSLRFRTPMRDEEHYRKNRSEWDSFNGTQGGTSSVQLKFDKPQDWSAYNRISFWIYVHPSTKPTYCIYMQIENEGTEYRATYPRKSHFVHDLKPGNWNHVLFEIPHLKRDKVTLFQINQMLTGFNPGEDSVVTYDIDQLELQLVLADQYEGWNVTPEKFAFSHAGYRPGDLKIAWVGNDGSDSFQLIDQNGKEVFSGAVQKVENQNGIFQQIDFTPFGEQGTYRIRCGSLESNLFPIDEDIWLQPVFKALNFFFCERCGYSVPGIHPECHRDWQGFRGDVKKIINGGWHDAGDLSQGAWRTSMAVYAMTANLEAMQGRQDLDELAQRLRTELVWGLEWLLKTRFGDGYHMSFSVMRIYTDNKTGTIDDVVSPARNVPWENFLASAVFARSAGILERSHPELARRAQDTAIEEWNAALASREQWDQAEILEAAWGATSSLLLAGMTGDKRYDEYAVRFGNLLVRCQEQSFLDGIPITGYFYTGTDRQNVIHNHHAAFEEAPMIALTRLCSDRPGDENWMDWYSTVVLYSEFFLKRGSQVASPYELLPNSVWNKREIMAEQDKKTREDMLQQFNDGTQLNEEYVLRTFPVYPDNLFHGNTNIHMSGTWALAEAARLRMDPEGMRLVGKQLQWIFGANPFGQSLMYGTGYDFAPQFAYCLKNVVGSLPVGMDCLSGDMPYWSATNDATHKEIWVEPVSRFLGAVSVYASQDGDISAKSQHDDLYMEADAVHQDDNAVKITLTCKGKGKHRIVTKVWNVSGELEQHEVDLTGNQTGKLELNLRISDPGKPYIVVFEADNNPGLRKEVCGSLINPSFQAL